MSGLAEDRHIKLLGTSIGILDVICDSLFVVPLSADATQLSKRIWETAQEMTSDREEHSKASQRALEAMVAMIMQGVLGFESSQQRGELIRLAEDLQKVHATIAMISSHGMDEGDIICHRSIDTSATGFEFFLRIDETSHNIGKIQREFKTPLDPDTLPASSFEADHFSAQNHVTDQPPALEVDPYLGHLWIKSHDVLSNNQGLYSAQNMTESTTPIEALEPNTSRGNNWELPDLTGKVKRVETQPAARGLVADYWKGIWYHGSRMYKVAIKVVWTHHYNNDNDLETAFIKRVWRRDLCVWRRLNHERVIPLLGVICEAGLQISFVCPWTENGNLNNYLKKTTSSLKVSDRFRMLCDISSGLAYLHSVSVVHGNLCGYRILIDSHGNAYISGFDCATILVEPGDLEPYSPDDNVPIHLAWAAPELVVFEAGCVPIIGPHNDIFSFGRVMLQILSGTIPFCELSAEQYTYFKLANGIHPQIPSRPWLTEAHRLFMLRCWADYRSGERPAVAEVVAYVNAEAIKAREEESRREKLIDFTGLLHRQSQYPSAGGGFADIWEALWQRELTTCKVAVKVLRHHVDDEDARAKINRRLRRELTVWQRLNHPNILPLYGVTSDFGFYPSLVCPWLENGNLNFYLQHQGERLSVQSRLQVLCDVAAGLCHLHSFADPIIHGDLTGSNVLIDANANACLCDFGLSTILAEFQGTSYFTSTISGSVRWAAPELYRVEDDAPAKGLSTGSDIYSFGSVMLQTLSGQVPYHDFQNLQVLHKLVHGEHPARPPMATMTDEYWSLIERCWAEHRMRPRIEKVHECISKFKEEISD